MDLNSLKAEISKNGFACLPPIYSSEKVDEMLDCIGAAVSAGQAFRKTEDVFAIRCFLREVPGISDLIFTAEMKTMIRQNFGENYFVIKSIYFDKPPTSNWFVSYHQDLSISIKEKAETPGYSRWTVKPGYFNVQPPVSVLESVYTLRIHLDETDGQNGALKVIKGSHKNGILRPEKNTHWNGEEVTCNVQRGGIMVMKPLLFHSSGRTTNGLRRRVIHLELSNTNLPAPLQWQEWQSI
ncbi:MAG: phytanoyl-CoA dioxygenase family protein [Bacteroidia bacterium]|nr:phytanoyl-CoA dioxygenase family protein [Bacteroidia bacterium]